MKLLLPFALTLVFVSSMYSQRPVVLKGATLIDGSGNAPLKDAVIVIEGTKIIAVGKEGELQVLEHAETIDVHGKFIIPGLIDCHIHYEQPRDLVQMLAWGVTSANCMFESTDQALEMEKRTANDSVHSPQIYSTAPIFTCEHGWWWGEGFPIDSTINRFPKTPEEAREQVRKVKGKGIKRIKLMYDDMSWCRDTLPRLAKMKTEIMTALVQESERESLLCEVHVPQLKDAKEVLEALTTQSSFGHDLAFAHGIIDEFIGPISSNATEEGAAFTAFSEEIKSKGVFYIPTFCVFEFLAGTRAFMKSVLEVKQFRTALPLDVVNRYTGDEYYQHYRDRYPNTDFVQKHLSTLSENVKVQIGFSDRIPLGTDMWALPGIAVHLELEYMVRAGMEPWRAIVAATNGSANFLGLGKRKWLRTERSKRKGYYMLGEIGTIDSGKTADILILDANPLDDIRNTRTVRTIIKHGVMFDHQQLIEESKR